MRRQSRGRILSRESAPSITPPLQADAAWTKYRFVPKSAKPGQGQARSQAFPTPPHVCQQLHLWVLSSISLQLAGPPAGTLNAIWQKSDSWPPAPPLCVLLTPVNGFHPPTQWLGWNQVPTPTPCFLSQPIPHLVTPLDSPPLRRP